MRNNFNANRPAYTLTYFLFSVQQDVEKVFWLPFRLPYLEQTSKIACDNVTVSFTICLFLSLALCRGEESWQPTEREKVDDIPRLLTEIGEIETEIERQQNENEEFKKVIQECKEMKTEIQHLLKTKQSKY